MIGDAETEEETLATRLETLISAATVTQARRILVQRKSPEQPVAWSDPFQQPSSDVGSDP